MPILWLLFQFAYVYIQYLHLFFCYLGFIFKMNENKLNQWIIYWKLFEINIVEMKINFWNKAVFLPLFFNFVLLSHVNFLNFVVFFFIDNPWKFYVTFWKVFIFQKCVMLTWDCSSNSLWHEYVSFLDDSMSFYVPTLKLVWFISKVIFVQMILGWRTQ